MMRVRIHRGAAEIGGNCIEVEAADGRRVVLDIGRPLWASGRDEVPLPEVEGLDGSDDTLVGVVISHPHLDHYGLLGEISPSVPVFTGRESASLVEAASFFSPMARPMSPTAHLVDRQPLVVGPFTVTPFLNDHSAFDAYSMLIEADGRRVFYTGDIRGHGRKRALFDRLVRDAPSSVDVLLMEGTHVRPGGAHDDVNFDSEADLEEQFVRVCGEAAGAVVVFGSAQNLDRLVTLFRLARRSEREFVVDLYGATVAAATRASIPQPGFDGLRVYVPQRQRVRVKASGEFERIERIRACRVFAEEIAVEPERFILHVPSSTAAELIRAGVIDQRSRVVWSLWTGYLEEPSGITLRTSVEQAGTAMEVIHSSGHASVRDLRRLVESMPTAKVVPLHSEATSRFAELFPRVEAHADGTWWEV